MSLLERLGRGRRPANPWSAHLPARLWGAHLNDQQFARLWTSQETHPHLDACADCRARFADFDGWLLGVGETLRAEADEAFSAERLAVQQAQIARRLETLERPARVIAFPKAARAVIGGHSHVRRWVTVAAAAGLIAGIGLGQVVPSMRTIRQGQSLAVPPNFTAPVAANRALELTPPATSATDDDDLLTDDFANPRVKNLSALDDMTPHARDFVSRAK